MTNPELRIRGAASHPAIPSLEDIVMLKYALLALAIAAVGGLILAAHMLRGKYAPLALSLLHGLFGATGLVLVITVLARGSAPQRVWVGLLLLAFAAVRGILLASSRLRQQVPRKAAVLLHAGLAVSGFLTLLSLVL
jgi:hypothetical protein